MPKIIITKEASDAVQAHATLPFRDTSVALPNGDREVTIDDEVYERLKSIALEGESISDTLIRAFAVMDRKANN